MDEPTIRDLLEDQVAQPPRTRLDVDQLIAQGGRLRGIRTTIGVASTLAVAALTALAIVVAPSLLRPTAGPAVPVPNGSATATARPTEPVPSTTLAVPGKLNPAVRYAAFGWLPAGLTDQWLTTDAAGYQLSAYYPGTAGAPGAGPGVSLILHPAADQPAGASPSTGPAQPSAISQSPSPSPSGTNSTGRGQVRIVAPAPTVTPPETTVTLQWFYAPRALAELTVSGLRPGDGAAREVAQRVASTLRYSIDTLVPLPLRPTKIPPSLPLRRMFLQQFAKGDPHPWQVRMEFSDTATDVGGQMFRALVVEGVASTARTGDGMKIPNPTTTFAGHPAYYEGSPYGQTLLVYDVEGMYVKVWNSDPAITQQLPAGGVKTVFLDIDIHPDRWS